MKDGTIKAIRNYENGILNGIQLNYYPIAFYIWAILC